MNSLRIMPKQEVIEFTMCEEDHQIYVTINKDFVRDEFDRIFFKWNKKLGSGLSENEREILFNNLINVFS